MKFPRVFYADRNSANSGAKAAMERHASRVLRRVAQDLRLAATSHEIVTDSRRGSSAVRVSLRTETLFVDVLERRGGSGVALSFRTRRGRSDLTGGGENHVALAQLETPAGYRAMLDGLRLAGGIDLKCGGRR
ncbi:MULTISPECIES: hypothetical protein [unclassified Caballeronia]|uniref:hypothetical protein n=1 Tax=unclassified Caballeronia TaxID=2646786 RepID=UPI00285DD723|nr:MULTISPECIES: hypothetical protein [unclassified Caballeronia]MDR5754934.1 hypothetical protein [Caballeronia sp. LZ024]MDR5845493.1 hypothetical protein [Caballeronia sp. LZ031]